MIKISVIIPIYNTEKYLKNCLDSVIGQTFNEMEIILINDASTDNSLKIIKDYLKLDNRIVLINKIKNEGLSAARNFGIKIAKGEYILHIDGDDWIEINYIQEVYNYAKQNDADIVILDYYKDFITNSIYVEDQGKKKQLNKIKVLKNIFLARSSPAVWNKLIKRELYIKNKIYHPEGVSIGEDLAVTPKLIYYSRRIFKLNKSYYHYIQNINSLTNKNLNSNKKIYDIYRVIVSLEKFFRKKEFYIEETKVNYLSGWILYSSINFEDEKYKNILDDYIVSLKKANIRNIKSIKIRIFYIFIKIFKNKKLIKRMIKNINKR